MVRHRNPWTCPAEVGAGGEMELAAESAKDIDDLIDRANRCLEAAPRPVVLLRRCRIDASG